jgi:hypothetical protein
LDDAECGGAKEISSKSLLGAKEERYAKGDTPKRPTRPSEALKKARVSTPASVMGTSAKD